MSTDNPKGVAGLTVGQPGPPCFEDSFMFDYYPVGAVAEPCSAVPLTARAQAVMISIGEEMGLALGRLAGAEGAALGDALRNMIMSGEVAPKFWPLPEAVRILATAGAAEDSCARCVLDALDELMTAIDQQEG